MDADGRRYGGPEDHLEVDMRVILRMSAWINWLTGKRNKKPDRRIAMK